MRTGYLTPIVKTRLFHIAIAARKARLSLTRNFAWQVCMPKNPDRSSCVPLTRVVPML